MRMIFNERKQAIYLPDPETEEKQEETEILVVDTRQERDRLLKESDWTQLLDSPLTKEEQEKWRVYRQQLRDMPLEKEAMQTAAFPKLAETVEMERL